MEYESKVGAPLMDMSAKEHWQACEHLANLPPHRKCCASETLQGQLAGRSGMGCINLPLPNRSYSDVQ